jgi:hypothetical protein
MNDLIECIVTEKKWNVNLEDHKADFDFTQPL